MNISTSEAVLLPLQCITIIALYMWLTRNEVRIPIRIPAVVVIPLFLVAVASSAAATIIMIGLQLKTSLLPILCLLRLRSMHASGEERWVTDWLKWRLASSIPPVVLGVNHSVHPQIYSIIWILLILSEVYGIQDLCKLACHVCYCPWPTCLIYNAYIPNGRPLIPSVTLIAADRPSLLWCSQNVQT